MAGVIIYNASYGTFILAVTCAIYTCIKYRENLCKEWSGCVQWCYAMSEKSIHAVAVTVTHTLIIRDIHTCYGSESYTCNIKASVHVMAVTVRHTVSDTYISDMAVTDIHAISRTSIMLRQ